MVTFLLRRLVFMAATLFAVSILVFGVSRASGDPRYTAMFQFSKGITKENWEALGKMYGLDKPLPVQYLIWAGNALRGDLGTSFAGKRPVVTAIAEKVQPTAELAILATAFAVAIGIPLGVLSAVRRGSIFDYMGRYLAVAGQAIPPFWFALVLILIFTVWLGWLPGAKRDGWDSYIMPVLTLGSGLIAGILRLVRSSMLEVLDSEYVKLARAKGASARAVVWKHALKNAVAAPLTYGGLLISLLFMGTVITESVFGWPGLGRLTIQATLNNDTPVLSGVVMFATLCAIVGNSMVDIIHALIDPRVRFR